ncbi:MAG TPA: hypothetical protein VEQ67_07865, partial [Mycobacterium sp.]|nr:hypothetical protein [Mycobacterium sp.]
MTTAATVPAGATSIALQTPFVAGHNHSVGSTVQPTPQDTTHFRAYVRNSHAAGGLAMQAGFASGDYEVGLVNPDGQGGVSATPLHIQMVPRIVQITPTTIYGQPAFILKAAGEAFDTNALLAIDGTSLSTTMNPDGSLQASVAQGLAEGTHEVRVTNPDGTFGTYRSLLVDTATTLTGFTPSSAYSDQNVEVTISGNNIGGPSGYYIAYIGLTPIQDTTLNPDGSLTVVIPMGLAAGEWRLRVTNTAGGFATAARPFVIRAPPSQLLPSVAPNGDVLPDNTLRLETRRFTFDPLGTTANSEQHGHLEYLVDGSTTPVEKYDLTPIDFGGLSTGLHLVRMHLVNNDGTSFPADDEHLVKFQIRGGTGTAGTFQAISPDILAKQTYCPRTGCRQGQPAPIAYLVPGERMATVAPVGASLPIVGEEQYTTGRGIPSGPDTPSGSAPYRADISLFAGTLALAILRRDHQGRYGLAATAPGAAGDYPIQFGTFYRNLFTGTTSAFPGGDPGGVARPLFSVYGPNGVYQHIDLMTVKAPKEILIGESGTITATIKSNAGSQPVVGRQVFLRIGDRYLEAYTDGNGAATFQFAPATTMRTTDYFVQVSFFGDYWWAPAYNDDNMVTIRFKGQPDVHVGPRPIDTTTPIQVSGEDWPGTPGFSLMSQIQGEELVAAIDVSALQDPIPHGTNLTLVSADGVAQTISTLLDADALATVLWVLPFTATGDFPIGTHIFNGGDFIRLHTKLTKDTLYSGLPVEPLGAGIADGAKLVVGYGFNDAQTVIASGAAAPGATTISVRSFTAIADFEAGSLIVTG